MAENIEVWADKLQHMEVTEMRDLMVDAGIKARPGQANRCALSDFLYEKTGQRFCVSVAVIGQLGPHGLDGQKVDAEATRYFYEGQDFRSERYELGTSAGKFAVMFDHRAFPEITE